MLMPPTTTMAVFPAGSTAVPLAVWAAPSVAIVTSAGQFTFPELSAQVKWTVTGDRYQPFAFGLVVAAPLIVRATLSVSMTNVTEGSWSLA